MMLLDFDAIDDSLIVGTAFNETDVPLLVELGITAVVSLQAEAPDPVEALERAGIAAARIECEDFHAPTQVQIEAAVTAVETIVGDGGRVYLHCFAGLQRSVTIAACCLIRRDPDRWNARTALERVRSRRRNACPTYAQIDSILAFDRMIRELKKVR